jgi:hypothetical protein
MVRREQYSFLPLLSTCLIYLLHHYSHHRIHFWSFELAILLCYYSHLVNDFIAVFCVSFIRSTMCVVRRCFACISGCDDCMVLELLIDSIATRQRLQRKYSKIEMVACRTEAPTPQYPEGPRSAKMLDRSLSSVTVSPLLILQDQHFLV